MISTLAGMSDNVEHFPDCFEWFGCSSVVVLATNETWAIKYVTLTCNLIQDFPQNPRLYEALVFSTVSLTGSKHWSFLVLKKKWINFSLADSAGGRGGGGGERGIECRFRAVYVPFLVLLCTHLIQI